MPDGSGSGDSSNSDADDFKNAIQLEERKQSSYSRKDEAVIKKHISSLSRAAKEFKGQDRQDDDYWDNKEYEHNRKRFIQWDNLKKQENLQASNEAKDARKARHLRCLTVGLQIAVILTGVFNFYASVNECYMILGENMRLEYLRKRRIHNCDAFLLNLSKINGMVHVLHAFFSAALIFANSKENGIICVFWIFSQAAETCLFLFTTSYNLRFRELPEFNDIAFEVCQLLVMDIFGTIFILLRYYQLTNPYTERKSKLHAMGSKKVLNFEIVFVHLPQFLQDKVSFRQAANYETMMILKNLYGEKRTPSAKPNKAVLKGQVEKGLSALKAVEHYSGIKKLRELKQRRQNMETKPLKKKKTLITKVFQHVFNLNENTSSKTAKQHTK